MCLDKTINSNKTKHVLVKNELKKLQTFDSSYFRDKNYCEDNGTQNYLAFKPMYKYLKKIGNTDHILERKSKGLSGKVIKPPSTSNSSFVPKLSYVGNKKKSKI